MTNRARQENPWKPHGETAGETTGKELGTLAEIIRHHTAAKPDACALKLDAAERTWRDLDQNANRVAQGLIHQGLRSQDRVAFLDKNGFEYFEVAFGAAKANMVIVAINWRLAPPEIAYTLNDAKAGVLIVGADFFGAVERIEAQLTSVTKIIAIGPHPRWLSYGAWLSAQVPRDPDIPSKPDDVCLQLYTSGTTGLPKGVMTTNANLFTLTRSAIERWQFDETSINLTCLPLFHIGGCGWAVVGLYVGATSVIAREFAAGPMLDTLQRENVTNVIFVPAMLGFMINVPGARERRFPALRAVVYGASPITNETLVQAMAVFNCPFIQLYGMTETTGGFTELAAADHDPGGERAYLLRSAGKAFPWVEIKVIAFDTGTQAAPRVIGEVYTRSAQNMAGYWAKPEETAKAFTADGWLKTGDAGYIDQDGYLFLTDRVKDMIVSGGENVYPAEVENVLAAHPAVAEVAVIGVPDSRWGETIMAFVVARPDQAIDIGEMLSFARERLAGFKCPTSVAVLPILPRNPSGKVLKRELRAPFWAGKTRHIN